MADLSTDVLVVGAGPVGLSLSLALSDAGIDHLVIDKHPSTTNHPKATFVNTRTMEHFRQWGVADEVLERGLPPARLDAVAWRTQLAGIHVAEIRIQPEDIIDAIEASPMTPCICPQDVIEPILLRAAERRREASISFGTRLEHFAQDADGATASIAHDGESREVRARFLVGADGRASTVREQLGIGLGGGESLGDMLNLYVRADVSHLVDQSVSPLYWILHPDANGVLITLNGTDRWLFNLPYAADAGETLADYPGARCQELVRTAIGDPDVPVELISLQAWKMTRLVADRYRDGRVFLAGDAVHQFPPTGGHGMNCGVGDAHNLAWKLAAVLHGWAGEGLLDSYEAERRPVALRCTDESARNASMLNGERKPPPAVLDPGPEGQAIRDQIASEIPSHRSHFLSPGLALGHAYVSCAVIDPDPTPSPVARYEPRGVPGHRAPHLWLQRGDERVSTQDLFRRAFVLLTGGGDWAEVAPTVAEQLGVPVDVCTVDPTTDVDGRFLGLYELDPAGAVLVRPDGHIAWRTDGVENPQCALAHALRTVLDLDHPGNAVRLPA